MHFVAKKLGDLLTIEHHSDIPAERITRGLIDATDPLVTTFCHDLPDFPLLYFCPQTSAARACQTPAALMTVLFPCPCM
jgi:hypothetical protein